MALPSISDTSDKFPSTGVTAHHTITVEPFTDRRCPEVHQAVVERFNGEVVYLCCRDVDLREGASIEDAAQAYARQFEADYVVAVTR